MGDGRVLLMGHANGQGWLASIDDSGQTMWEKTFPSAEVASILNASRTRDGFVLLGSPPARGDEPAAWVGKITRDGALLAQQRLPVDCDTIAASDDGTTLMLNTRRGRGTVEPWSSLLAPDLKEQRPATTIVSAVQATSTFTATALRDHQWLIAGPTKDHLPWFALVGSDGKVGWSDVRPFDAKLIPRVGSFFVASDGSSGFAAFSLWALNARREHRVTVHVLKFRVQQ
jgi:hypothetical protein